MGDVWCKMDRRQVADVRREVDEQLTPIDEQIAMCESNISKIANADDEPIKTTSRARWEFTIGQLVTNYAVAALLIAVFFFLLVWNRSYDPDLY